MNKLEKYLHAEHSWNYNEDIFLICNARPKSDKATLTATCFSILHCTKGSLTCEISGRKYALVEDSLIILLPRQKCTLSGISTDFSCNALTLSAELCYYSSIKDEYWVFPNIMDSPLIHLTFRNKPVLNSVYQFIAYIIDDMRDENKWNLLLSLLRPLSIVFADTMGEKNESNELHILNMGVTTMRFCKLLTIHCPRWRNISFYADTLSVTPKYLSAAVKRDSGHTASWWINLVLMREANQLLANRELTIQEIAAKLCFENQVQFSKWFKRQTGSSPSEYRQAGRNTALGFNLLKDD